MDKSLRVLKFSFTVIFCLIAAGCKIQSGGKIESHLPSTPTPTNIGAPVKTEPTTENPCESLSGTLTLEILVGPADLVGLDPVTLGNIPFTVQREGESYILEGASRLDYYSDILAQPWGSYSVTFEGETVVTGNCVINDDEAILNISVEMTGEQNVEVAYEGTQLNYPWSGIRIIEASLPFMEGSREEGEGWILTLSLSE